MSKNIVLTNQIIVLISILKLEPWFDWSNLSLASTTGEQEFLSWTVSLGRELYATNGHSKVFLSLEPQWTILGSEAFYLHLKMYNFVLQ